MSFGANILKCVNWPKLRADAGGLEEQPLQHVVFLRHVLGQEFAGFLGEVHEDRARLDHRIGLAARAFVVDDRWNFRVRIDLDEIGAVLVALPHVNEVLLVGQLRFLEHDVDFLHVRAGQCIKVDHGNILLVVILAGERRNYRAAALPARLMAGQGSWVQGSWVRGSRGTCEQAARSCAESSMPRRLGPDAPIGHARSAKGEGNAVSISAMVCRRLRLCRHCHVRRGAPADDYPNHRVRWLVGYPPGGSTDICARLIGQYLSEHLGQQFAIENKPGAGNNLATEMAAHSPPGRLYGVPGQSRQHHQRHRCTRIFRSISSGTWRRSRASSACPT